MGLYLFLHPPNCCIYSNLFKGARIAALACLLFSISQFRFYSERISIRINLVCSKVLGIVAFITN